jgi:hypothetical protein
MIINEIDDSAGPNLETAKIAGLAQFLIGRADDTGAPKKISTKTFLKLANDMGIALTSQQLLDIAQRPPLNKLISDVQGDEETGDVMFAGSVEEPTTMSVDKARDTVNKMAQRASKNKGL